MVQSGEGYTGLDWPQSGPVPKFQDRTEFLWFGLVRSGKKSDRTGLHQNVMTATEVGVRAIQDHKVIEWNTCWKCRLSEGTDDK